MFICLKWLVMLRETWFSFFSCLKLCSFDLLICGGFNENHCYFLVAWCLMKLLVCLVCISEHFDFHAYMKMMIMLLSWNPNSVQIFLMANACLVDDWYCLMVIMPCPCVFLLENLLDDCWTMELNWWMLLKLMLAFYRNLVLMRIGYCCYSCCMKYFIYPAVVIACSNFVL